jgi:hypothetical protein
MERGSELEKVDTAAIPAITVSPTAEELEFSTVAPAPPEVTAAEEVKDEQFDPVTADVVMEINVAKDDDAAAAEELEFSTVALAPPEVTAAEEEDEEFDPVTADVVMEINVAKDDAAVQENNKDEEEEYEEKDDGDDGDDGNGNGDDEGHPHDKAAAIEEHASAVQHLRVSGLEDFLASIVGGGKSPESINTLLGRAVGCAQFCHEKVRITFMPSKLFLTCSTISIDA